MSFYPLFYIICLSNIESAISFASQKIYKKAIQALSSMSRWLPMGRDPRVIDRAIGQLSYSPKLVNSLQLSVDSKKKLKQ